MRSRYAAFALGLGEYLVRTLALGHEDLKLPRAELVQALSRAKDRQKFLDLCILSTSTDGATNRERGEVLFYGRIFERGNDQSFAELSTFVREGEGWRYVSGVLVPRADLPNDPRSLTLETFRTLASRSA